METTRRRPRSPVLGGCTLNYYQIRAKSHLLTGLSVTALSPAAVFDSSPKYIHRGPQPFAVTQTCWSLATRTGTVTWPWRSCALLSRCLGSMLLQRKDTKGGHVSLQRQFFVSPFLLGSGNVYQLCAPPAPKSCPKPKARWLATPKCTTTIQDSFTRAYSLLPSDFDAVESYLRQVLDLKQFPTCGKSSQSLKTRKRLNADGSV